MRRFLLFEKIFCDKMLLSNIVESGRFMEIILGENAGFCYGVKRAVDGAELEVKNADGKIYCLGEIVHNKEVVDELKEKGLKFIENISEADATTIIRAHGVSKEVYKYADENGIDLKDYTCPNVLKIHKLAEEYSSNGYFIILFGSKKHPENVGTISYCGEHYFVVENEDELFFPPMIIMQSTLLDSSSVSFCLISVALQIVFLTTSSISLFNSFLNIS